ARGRRLSRRAQVGRGGLAAARVRRRRAGVVLDRAGRDRDRRRRAARVAGRAPELMATPAAVLSILVSADTKQASAALTKYDKQLEATNEIAAKGIETRLGSKLNPAGFDAYQ